MRAPLLASDRMGGLTHRERRVVITASAGIATFMLPWTALLATRLPPTAKAYNWALAWSGLDLAEASVAGATAVLVAKDDRRAAVTSAALATLLAVDAWFDVTTSAPGRPRLVAALSAAALELPVAAGAVFLAVAISGSGRRPKEVAGMEPAPEDLPAPEDVGAESADESGQAQRAGGMLPT